MDAPANYDGGQTISVYPTALYQATFYRDHLDGIPDSIHPAAIVDGKALGTVPEMMQLISNSFQTIYNIWGDLKLSWSGDTADAAQELQAKLDKLQSRLYGKKLVPIGDVPGVIGQMSAVAARAASNYSNVEEANTDMFDKLRVAINWQPLPPEDLDDDSGDNKPADNGPAPSTDDSTDGPVTEIF
jgi:hypothetical protein